MPTENKFSGNAAAWFDRIDPDIDIDGWDDDDDLDLDDDLDDDDYSEEATH